ncbi:MAG: [FeFe] hydrogenase H-cluster radical SAM maturase HydG [Candidatus Omnitrophica bacterium]|nr:[FeFe] hydrogenase H-cluster radical SAM maturase HydG [Candidatus Omnitrophota bacterium]
MKTFINDIKISRIISRAKFSKAKARGIIKKASRLKGLSLNETALLLNCNDPGFLKEIFKAAREIKNRIYGKRVVLFAPLYLSNKCVNDCLYCGFRSSNTTMKRKTLTFAEIKKEVEALQQQGHKRLLLVAAEGPDSKTDYLEKVINIVYKVKKGKGAIRRVNINAAPLTLKEFKRLKKAGIGTYQLFQETYHRKTYGLMHPKGPKSDFEKRLYAMDLAQEAGIDDVGLGALFGLYDYRFEVLALLCHAHHLEAKFGVGPHTISVPRIEPASGAPVSLKPPYPVSDPDFKKIVAVLRLAVPYTGLILTTRESAAFRNELLRLGISQISAGSRTNPGGYAKGKDAGQFSVSDNRSLEQVVGDIIKMGFIPSFCTACYRKGRTGEDFMDLAKPGDIQDFCLPNALLTFKEYLLDYYKALPQQAKALVDKEIKGISSPAIKKTTLARLKELENGRRDLFF